MKKQIVSIALIVALVTSSYSSVQEQQATPNVILVYADDLGRGLLGYEGQDIIKPPNIDKLADQGVRFENAYGCHYCAPARASLLSGYHDGRTDKWQISKGGEYLRVSDGVSHNDIQQRLNQHFGPTPEDEIFLAQVFQKAGYITGQVGKLDWGFLTTHERLKRHGWDYYYGYYDHVRCHGFFPPFLFENGEQVNIAGNTHRDCSKESERDENGGYEERWDMTGKEQFSQNLFLDKILQFIRDNKNEKFFLYHPTQLPHGPTSIPEIHIDFRDNPALTELEKAYASMVKMLDDHVGMIVEELKKQGIYEDTLLVFTSDNGHEIYYPSPGKMDKPVRNMQTGKRFNNLNTKYYSHLAGDVFNGNDGMAGMKRDNWEGGVRVPLIYHWPGRIEGGKVLDQMVANYDMLSTFADMLDVEVPNQKDGLSYWSAFFGDTAESHEYVVFNSKHGPALVAADGWKIRYQKTADTYQLYFLPEDYTEAKNLTDQYPEKVETLKEKLLIECGGIKAPTEPPMEPLSY
jgi:arylsulfatase A-like enzyme